MALNPEKMTQLLFRPRRGAAWPFRHERFIAAWTGTTGDWPRVHGTGGTGGVAPRQTVLPVHLWGGTWHLAPIPSGLDRDGQRTWSKLGLSQES